MAQSLFTLKPRTARTVLMAQSLFTLKPPTARTVWRNHCLH